MKIEIIKKICFVMFIIVATFLIVAVGHIDNKEKIEEKRYKVSDRVSVDKNIIAGYEGEAYIPRCSRLNERLKV